MSAYAERMWAHDGYVQVWTFQPKPIQHRVHRWVRKTCKLWNDEWDCTVLIYGMKIVGQPQKATVFGGLCEEKCWHLFGRRTVMCTSIFNSNDSFVFITIIMRILIRANVHAFNASNGCPYARVASRVCVCVNCEKCISIHKIGKSSEFISLQTHHPSAPLEADCAFTILFYFVCRQLRNGNGR